jgi:hypothetical protein
VSVQWRCHQAAAAAEIVETEYFQKLKIKAGEFRGAGSNDRDGGSDGRKDGNDEGGRI